MTDHHRAAEAEYHASRQLSSRALAKALRLCAADRRHMYSAAEKRGLMLAAAERIDPNTPTNTGPIP